MKNRKCLVQQALSGSLLALLALLHPFASAGPLGTAFTYQGRLSDGGSLATGSYDLKFYLYDANLGGNLVGTPTSITLAPVPVSNGLFTVTLDFGSATFGGEARWLEIAVRTNGSLSAHTTLAPRQPLTAAPYALFAPLAATATSVPWSSLTSVPTGFADGSAFWKTAGNNGTSGVNFLGTADSQPLELKVNSARAFRLEPNSTSPNVIGGFQDNLVLSGKAGGIIGGGGQLGLANIVIGDFGVIGGGLENTSTTLSMVGGGQHNHAYGSDSVVGGGFNNTAGGFYSAVGGGYGNTSSGDEATVAGGFQNTSSGLAATVAGGAQNMAAGARSFAAGSQAKALHDGSFVWGDLTGADFSSTAPNQFLIRASAGVGIGTASPSKALDVRDGTGASGNGGSIHVGGIGANGDPKLINFGDGDYVHIGEIGADDRMELKAGTFVFTNVPFENGFVGIGTATPAAKLDVIGEARVSVLTITGGADVAEPFQLATENIPKGSVVVIDEEHPGELKLSTRAYDRHVAGIVSGANGIRPGLTLRQQGSIDGTDNVALSGRVYALADASNGAIKPGDLLTTSEIPGHAMKATNRARANGAIIGKAMTSLKKGHGMVLVLVSLQ
jgi:hypothetical protein